MGIKLFRKKDELIVKQMQEIQNQITTQNQLNRALYDLISSGMALTKDSSLKDYVSDGFEGNTDVFGILLKLSTKFSLVKYYPYKIQSNGKEVLIDDPKINRLLNNPNYYQSGSEFKRSWFIYKYTTGSAIVYAPKFENGINKGQITNDGLIMMPTQNIDIYTGGFRKPVDYYTLDINQQYKIQASDVWHERIPSLEMMNGENFMGTSPLKVAMNIINMQNGGFELASNLFKGGHPPGILSKEGAEGEIPKQQEKKFREHYARKYLSTPEDSKIPVFTMGKIQYVKIGYDSLKDLQVLEMSENGMRALCRVLQVSPQLFGDTSASTYDNVVEAWKAAWRDVLMPECENFAEGFTNQILSAYGDGIVLRPDYSNIGELQEDKERIAKIYDIGVKNGSLSRDEWREGVGFETIGTPEMQQRYLPMNMIPDNEEIINEDLDESNKFYKRYNIEDKL